MRPLSSEGQDDLLVSLGFESRNMIHVLQPDFIFTDVDVFPHIPDFTCLPLLNLGVRASPEVHPDPPEERAGEQAGSGDGEADR